MKKLLIVFLLALLLLLISSSISFANNFNLSTDFSEDLKYEYYIKNDNSWIHWAAYIDYFKRHVNESSYSTTIVGLDYFTSNKSGLYFGGGLPLFRNYDSSLISSLESKLGSAYKSGIELRAGFRVNLDIATHQTPIFIDLGYSNIKEKYLDLGINF